MNYFKEEGFLPEALINFFALLGWNPGTEQEYYTKEDLIKSFSTKGLNAAAAVFDEDKLLWINSEHIKNLDNQSLWEKLIPFFKKENLTFKEDKNWQDSLLDNLKSGFKTLKQAVEILKPFSLQGFQVKDSAKPVFEWPQSKPFIERWLEALEKYEKDHLSFEDFTSIKKTIEGDLKGKEFFMPLRCALLGEPQGAEVKILVTLLERKELIRRAKELLKQIK